MELILFAKLNSFHLISYQDNYLLTPVYFSGLITLHTNNYYIINNSIYDLQESKEQLIYPPHWYQVNF